MKVLIIAPHMDDEVLGCGGTILRHVDEGHQVSVCVVANRAYGHVYDEALIQREKEACKKAQGVLGYHDLTFLDLPDERLDTCQIDIIVPLEAILQRVSPDIVYFPHRGDMNQDHRAVFEAARVACRPFAPYRIRSLRVYEVPSSTDQITAISEWPFCPTMYVNIADTLAKKIEAMACYETESRTFPHPRSPDGLTTYAKKRGMEIGMAAAEAFMVLRETWW